MKHLPFSTLFLYPRVFRYIGLSVLLFVLSFPWNFLFLPAIVFLAAIVVFLVWEVFSLYRLKRPSAERNMARLLSMGDLNKVIIKVFNPNKETIRFTLIDELPKELQIRDFKINSECPPKGSVDCTYSVHPKQRGLYEFGRIQIFIQSKRGFVERRITLDVAANVRVVPSLIQVKKYNLASIQKLQHYKGIIKSRRIGHGYEFEQINAYVEGDDYRSVNWKATSRHNQLMVNHYTDERSQSVYCLIDKSRQMLQPFKGMTLLDYAVNSALVLSNVSIEKHDRAGLVTFSDSIHTMLRANDDPKQMRRILESLYNERESRSEGNYPLLYKVINSLARTRSLLFLYSNFESSHTLHRLLPQLLQLHKRHLLVVVFFKNDELESYARERAKDTTEIYMRTTVAKMITDKRLLIQTLNNYGINTLYTHPDELTLNSLNKYLELKARGLI